MRVMILTCIAIWSFTIHGVCAQSETTYSTQARFRMSVNYIPAITSFSFGGEGFSGRISEGEILFKRIANQSNALEQFVLLYSFGEGNNQAQMYAMVGFYYLDKTLYNHIKTTYSNASISVTNVEGCIVLSMDLQALLQRVESGAYDNYVPKSWIKKSTP